VHSGDEHRAPAGVERLDHQQADVAAGGQMGHGHFGEVHAVDEVRVLALLGLERFLLGIDDRVLRVDADALPPLVVEPGRGGPDPVVLLGECLEHEHRRMRREDPAVVSGHVGLLRAVHPGLRQ
jgi:hypothetical protein